VARRPVERPDPLPVGQPSPTFELVFANSKAEKSRRLLLRERRTELRECWDHLAYRPAVDLPRRCGGLAGRFKELGWRQYEIGPKQRVWFIVEGNAARIIAVWRSHPKATE
jgi:hypothetical protein